LLYLWYLENDNPAALVSGGEELSILVELHAGDDISCNKVRIKYCTLPTGRRPSTEKKHNKVTRNSKWGTDRRHPSESKCYGNKNLFYGFGSADP
jgi:hypothetical protein